MGSSSGMLILNCLLDSQVEVPNSWVYESRAQVRGQYMYIIICLGVTGKWVPYLKQ